MSANRKTRVGVLLDSTWCDAHLFSIIEELAKSGEIELFYLLNFYPSQSRRESMRVIFGKIRVRGLRRVLNLIAFRRWARLEKKLSALFMPVVRMQKGRGDISPISHAGVVPLHPEISRSGYVARYSDGDVAAVESLELDLMIRGNVGTILRGSILGAAKEGILSFHHGDNRWNRGVPPGFWEVYHGKATTGFVIQVLTEDLDGGRVIFRGNLRTARTWAANVAKLNRDSYPYMAKIVTDYAKSGELPAPEIGVPYGGALFRAPSVAQLGVYLIRSLYRAIPPLVSRVVLRQRLRWGVAFVQRTWPEAILGKGTRVANPHGRYLADPFVVKRDDRTVCFVEDYTYQTKISCISAVELKGPSSYEFLGPVIQEDFPMSFPYVFEYQDGLYMVPETRHAKAVRLYRCVEFPMNWRYERDLVSDIYTVDSMVFEWADHWWLFTNSSLSENAGCSSRLEAYHTDDPISGEWKPHERNPLIVDSTIARNAGILRLEDGRLVRCRQRPGFRTYGHALSLALISELSPASFEEHLIGEVSPDFFPNLVSCHHLHGNTEYTVYDYAHLEVPT